MMKKDMFYKYRAMSTNLIESLCYDKIFYASPATFNDPLDCQMFALENDISVEELRKIYAQLKYPKVLKNAERGIRGSEFKKNMQLLLAEMAHSVVIDELNNINYDSTNPDYTCTQEEAEIGILTSNIRSELRDHYSKGVSCFSQDGNNMLMWSHYGDQHKGICIGYSQNRTPTPDIKKVIYGKYGIIKTSSLYHAFVENDNAEKNIIESEILLKKSSAWRYEREYRLISSTGLHDSPLMLEEITFGLQCPYEIRHTIIRMLDGRKPGVKYYEMVRKPNSEKLTKIAYDRCEWGNRFPITAQSGLEIFGKFTTNELPTIT